MKSTKPNKRAINEFFSTIYGLALFTIKSLFILIREDMKKESQTYKEEREQQKQQQRQKRKRKENG